MSNSNSDKGFSGLLIGLLTISFIVLKLTHCIDWSWWWVLSPLWIPAVSAIAIGLFVLIIQIIITFKAKRKIKKHFKDLK